MAFTDINSEDRLVQKTFADHLHDKLGWESAYPRGCEYRRSSDILAATGRTPNTAGIALDTAGVRLDERGYIQVNDRLDTSAPDVWAIGECAGSPQFTHVSEDDFRVLRDKLAGGSRTTRDRLKSGLAAGSRCCGPSPAPASLNPRPQRRVSRMLGRK